MSSPMTTTMLGLCPAVAGAVAGCWACAGLVSPTAENAEAATRELPLNRRSRRFNPALLLSDELVSFGRPSPWLLMASSPFGFAGKLTERLLISVFGNQRRRR